jgi:ABC-2 type transport system ATP-binding protein
MTELINVQNLTKLYGEFRALDAISFGVRAGEVLGLVGPNGAGKTTTLRALAGIHPPTEGLVQICGHDIRLDGVAAKQNIAFMPDEPRLFDYMTVLEHLQFTARIYSVTGWRERADVLLSELELSDKRDALPGELSRGMKQKLMIACGLIHDPRVIIFDEPLTGLDPLGIRKMKATINRRAEAGAAIILSSHLLALVEELCERVLILQNGTVRYLGSIHAVKSATRGDASLEEAFIAITSEPVSESA